LRFTAVHDSGIASPSTAPRYNPWIIRGAETAADADG